MHNSIIITSVQQAITNYNRCRAKLHDALLHYEGGDMITNTAVPPHVPVYYLELEPGSKGQYNPNTRTITVSKDLDSAARILTLTHESRHAWQHSVGMDMHTNYHDSEGNIDVLKYLLTPLEIDAREWELIHVNSYLDVLSKEEIDSTVLPKSWYKEYFN